MKNIVEVKTVILGIGNILLKDEGAGIHVMENFKKNHLNNFPGISLIDGGTLSFSLLQYFSKNSNLIVLDAAELKEDPGTVKVFENQKMDEFLGRAKRTAHEVSLLDLMDMARLSDNLPKRRALIGIQPADIDWGEELTAQLKPAVDTACNKLIGLLEKWQI